MTNFVVSFVRDKKRVVESLVDVIQIHVIFFILVDNSRRKFGNSSRRGSPFFKLRRTWLVHVVVLQRAALQNVEDLEPMHCSPYIAPFVWWRCHCGLRKLPDDDYRAPGESVLTKINWCARGLNLVYTLHNGGVLCVKYVQFLFACFLQIIYFVIMRMTLKLF